MTFDPTTPSAEHSPATTLTSAAHGGLVIPPPHSSRLTLIVGASAVVAGGTFGSALALRSEPASAQPASTSAGRSPALSPAAPEPPAAPPRAPASAPPPAAPAAVPAAAADASPALGDLRLALIAQIKDELMRFVAWSHDHARARCPDPAALGAPVLDPWGSPLRITCTDQPADQIAGIVSLGPDRVAGTRDDVASWTLGADVTDVVRGPRWAGGGRTTRPADGHRAGAAGTASAPPLAPPLPLGATAPPVKPPASTGAGSNDTDGDGIPDRR